MTYIADQRGFSLIAAVVMMIIFAILSVTVASLVSTDSDISFYQLRSTEALYIARAGIERALYEYGNGTTCTSLSYTNSLGSGSSTTTGTLYNPASTTLSADIDSSTTTIPVVDTTGYAPHGRITINSETIDYTSTTATSFTGARRGAAGTTAASHSSGASGGIVFDAVSSTASGAVNGTTLSWSHTIGSQSDRVLVVGVEIEDGSASDAVVSSVTYNGTNLTRAASAIAGTSFFQNVELWYLLEAGLPPAGNYTVTVTTTGTTNNRNGGSISLYNVNQAAPEATNSQTSDSGQSTFNTTITTLTDGAWVVDAIGSGNNDTSFTTNQTGQTERYDSGNAGGSSTGAGSTKEVATAGSTTMGWNVSGSNRLAHVVAAFAPAEVSSVSQDQCLVRSTGTVTTTGLGTAQRVVEAGVQ